VKTLRAFAFVASWEGLTEQVAVYDEGGSILGVWTPAEALSQAGLANLTKKAPAKRPPRQSAKMEELLRMAAGVGPKPPEGS
jgi:hypothetical protein